MYGERVFSGKFGENGSVGGIEWRLFGKKEKWCWKVDGDMFVYNAPIFN